MTVSSSEDCAWMVRTGRNRRSLGRRGFFGQHGSRYGCTRERPDVVPGLGGRASLGPPVVARSGFCEPEPTFPWVWRQPEAWLLPLLLPAWRRAPRVSLLAKRKSVLLSSASCASSWARSSGEGSG